MLECNDDKQIIIERDVVCVVRDQIKLYANIYRPKQNGKYPVLLSRLPYNKDNPEYSHRYVDPMRLALKGYVVIIQDVRGRFASEGDFNPFVYEANDGYDAVEWAASLPYSNGEVGMYGLSYQAFTQLSTLLKKPSSLKALFPAMSRQVIGEIVHREGIIELAWAETWILNSIAKNFLMRKQEEGTFSETIDEIYHDLYQIDEWYKFVPIKDWPPIKKHKDLMGIFEQYIYQSFKKESYDELETNHKKESQVPAYHLAGWYDNFLGSTIRNFENMNKDERNQKLIIGPWGHGIFEPKIGERFFGPKSSGASIDGLDDLTSLHINWFDFWLKNNKEAISDFEFPVKIFVMGINEWRLEKEWPLARTQYTPFYLHSDGNAADKNGELSRVKPNIEPSDQYIYNPHKPTPTYGGNIQFYNKINVGPYDQNGLEKRKDILVYTSSPLEEPLEVTGWIKMVLWVSSDAIDTDFVVKLIDVSPEGNAFNLTEGIIRVKYRNGKKVEYMNKSVVKLTIDLWATSNVFLAGHSIRIDIASSSFPKYDLNPNTGKTTFETSKMVEAKQTVYHQKEYPSHILLPVIPDDQK